MDNQPKQTLPPPPPLNVKVTYTLPRDETQSKEFASSELAILGTPSNHLYCGRHNLLPPEEGGSLECLIASIQQAKQYNDAYLTEQKRRPKNLLLKMQKKTNVGSD